ncbi:hypothetical protein U879_16755 [Defluviimonas sp. 20V17]|uniref:Group 4 capsule polysaccharide lipoprotein gfcB, YjbF n=1 Tax=Allgaiera indica TaxID=765699 RepID=A0AAN4UQS2_9RHOB|nr:YjbF family lipoprotein [Allgaiera indica]KDB02549.1 hypothetical protein U879_16755 [Defluviimonas sp. 20V17]GHE01577.1 hypothetical protein GCM10008024_17420 [Allgaiera indica]SDW98628.1 Group 4 capsule polysaccharide lipoprotein gfcB, YjbF [Allgaiera indica]
MTPMGRTLVVLALAAVGLAGCSSNKVAEGQDKLYLRTAKQVLSFKKPAQPHLTRAQITSLKRPLYLAVLPKRGARAYLLHIGANGDVATWSSTDGIMISLRDGVVVRTLGLGQDLMSARLPSAAVLRKGAGTVSATYYYLTGDDQSYGVPVTCQLSRLGRQTVQIAGLSYATMHVREACAGEGGQFTNDYWIEPNGQIRKSRQWISKEVGYLKLEDLRP